MFRRYFFIILCILLAACSAAAQTALSPSNQITLPPSATPTFTPSPVSTESPTAVSPEPTKDPDFFRDDFDVTLDAQWSWVREDPLNWSLTAVPGSLQINVQGGYVPQHTISNLLLRPAPEGNFQIEAQVTFRPQDNFQFAGLIIYESDSDFIQAGRSYCGTFECVGEGLYMAYYQNGDPLKPDFGQPYKEIDPILIRLTGNGERYSFEASTDGKVWFMIGSHTSDIVPLQIGLVTGQRLQGRVLPAVFDYFEVRGLP